MKTSELIKRLEELKKKHGDLDVVYMGRHQYHDIETVCQTTQRNPDKNIIGIEGEIDGL